MFKEGVNEMETKPNLVKEAITHTIEKNKIDTFNITDKPQESKSKKISSSAINQTRLDHCINKGH